MDAVATLEKTKKETEQSPICLYPDEILSGYKLIEPSGYVTVRGTVRGLRPYKNICVYGDLEGNDHSISFKCPPDKSPTKQYENVILGGFLNVKPAKFHNGLDIVLEGEVVGSWAKDTDKISEFILLERQSPKTLLSTFLRSDDKNVSDLLVIGTKRGLSDYKTSFLQENELLWNEEVINDITDLNKFTSDVEQAIEKHKPKAITILRGGSTAEKGMKIWNDAKVIDFLLKTECKIYSAIGHSDGFVILDKYADQHFSTPNDFGHIITNEIKRISAEKNLAAEYGEISNDNDILKERLGNTELRYEQQLSEEKSKATEYLSSSTQNFEKQIESLRSINTKLILTTTILGTLCVSVLGILLYHYLPV
jgi:hypothetical protein